MKCYSSLHEGADTIKLAEILAEYSNGTSDFTGSSWDLIRAENESKEWPEALQSGAFQKKKSYLKWLINDTAEVLKKHLDSDDPQLVYGIVVRFNDISVIAI